MIFINSKGVSSSNNITASTNSKAAMIIERDFSSVMGLLAPLPSRFAETSEFTPTIRISPLSFALPR